MQALNKMIKFIFKFAIINGANTNEQTRESEGQTGPNLLSRLNVSLTAGQNEVTFAILCFHSYLGPQTHAHTHSHSQSHKSVLKSVDFSAFVQCYMEFCCEYQAGHSLAGL